MKSNFKKILAMLLALLMLGSLMACGNKSDSTDPADSSEDAAPAAATEGTGDVTEGLVTSESGAGKTIGFSIASLAGNPFWQVMLDRLTAGFEARGYEVKYADGGGDVTKQMEDIQNFIGMGVAAIVINPYASDSVVDVSKQAEAAGIPVFAVDIPIGDEGYCIATFICDNFTLGKESGKLAASQFSKGETVDAIILSGYAGGEDSWDRRMGFISGICDYQIENYSGTNFNVLYQIYCNYEQEMAYEKMVDIITTYNGDFDVVFCENDAMAMGAITAIEEANLNPADYIVLGIDGIRQGYENIMDGKQFATGVNSPIDVADLTVDGVDRYLNGDVTVSGTAYTQWAIVTADNVSDYYDVNSLY